MQQTANTLSSLPQGDEPMVRAVLAAKKGDRNAWNQLYARFAPVIHALLLLHMRRHEAEDLTQDVFLRAMAKLHTLREPGAIGAWLCTIARNEAASWARRDGRVQLRLTPTPPEPASPGREEPSLDGEQVLEQVRQLPEAYRETLVLRLVCGLTGPQIAAVTGMTEGSVRVNLFRGMTMLRESLGKAAKAGGAA